MTKFEFERRRISKNFTAFEIQRMLKLSSQRMRICVQLTRSRSTASLLDDLLFLDFNVGVHGDISLTTEVIKMDWIVLLLHSPLARVYQIINYRVVF